MQRMQSERDEKERVKAAYTANNSITEFSPCGRYCWKRFSCRGTFARQRLGTDRNLLTSCPVKSSGF